MEIETVGENAGKVWRNLNENRGEISIQELSRKMNLSAIDVAIYGAQNETYIED